MELLKPCIKFLSVCLSRQIIFLLNSRKGVEDMNNSRERLTAMKTDVETAIEAAERNSRQPSEQVKLWLKKVEKLQAKVQAVNVDYEPIHGRHPLDNFMLPNLWPSILSCGSKAAEYKDEAIGLVQERAGIRDLTVDRGPDCVQRIAGPSSFVGKAMEQNLETVREYLQNDEVGVIGIWGMGGVGKSALLSKINNSLKGDGNLGFDFVIWVVASKDLQLKKLKKDIAERLRLQDPTQILGFLENKNFLLLLDDLWEGFDLTEIGIPQPLGQNQRRQKVVLTTRSEGVCTCMNACKARIQVGCLDPVEALQLFEQAVGEMVDADQEIETLKLKEKVAKECDGLPLALLTIGKAMSNKKKVQQWRNALSKLQSHSGDIGDMDRVFSRLQISYDGLKENTEKECFLHCSLWPEDTEIGGEELIWCWLGHGLIDFEDFQNKEAAFDYGYSIIEDLKEACLLEPGQRNPSRVKMHDIMRDLAARLVGKTKWSVIVEIGTTEELKRMEVKLAGVEKAHIDIYTTGYFSRPYCPNLSECSNLSTLILSCPIRNVDTRFVRFFPALRYLDLSCREILNLSEVIGCLPHLEHLRLDGRISDNLLDEIANLSKLKYLILFKIQAPAKLMVKLQKLLVIHAERGRIDTSKDATEDYDIEDFYRVLQRREFVSVTRLTVSFGDVEGLSHVKMQELCIRSLETEKQKTFHLQALSNNMQQITGLHIVECEALEKLVMDNSCLPRLQSLKLHYLPKLLEITWGAGVRPSVGLPQLEILEIADCDGLKNVSWVLQLPSLRELSIWECNGIEYVIAGAKEVDSTFPKLEKLNLVELSQLCGICEHPIDFPSLKKVEVFYCPELKRLSFKVPQPENKEKHESRCKTRVRPIKINKKSMKVNTLNKRGLSDSTISFRSL